MYLSDIFRSFLVITLCLLAPLPSCAQEAALRLVTLDYPPYILNDNDQAKGPIVDIVREAFRRMGRSVTIEFFPWSRSLSMVTSGTADGLFTIKKTADRESTLRYPNEPLLSQDYVFFVRRDSTFRFDGDYASIANARIGVISNTSYGTRFDAAVKQGIFTNLDISYDYEHVFRMLQAGRIDIVICSHLVGLKFIRQINAADQIVVSGPPSETARSYLVFTRKYDSATLSNAFDQAIAAMRRDGTLSRMIDTIR